MEYISVSTMLQLVYCMDILRITHIHPYEHMNHHVKLGADIMYSVDLFNGY
jgi:hypothetical protein